MPEGSQADSPEWLPAPMNRRSGAIQETPGDVLELARRPSIRLAVMNAFVTIVLVVATLAICVSCITVRTPRAFCTILAMAWLFMPAGTIDLPGLPGLNKVTGVGLALLAGALMSPMARPIRFHWVDGAVLMFGIAPLASSLTSGLGLYDGVSSVMVQVLTWSTPYLAGRMVLHGRAGLEGVLFAIGVGGIVYVPLCVLELAISPQLHRIVYGFHQHAFIQTVRGDGFRPMVFMQHPLATALWMATATIALLGLRTTAKSVMAKTVWTVSAVVVGIVTVACKSAGAFVLLLGALGGFFAATSVGFIWPLYAMALVLPVFIGLRLIGISLGDLVVELAGVFEEGRAMSLQTRLDNEERLLFKAFERLVFGHGSQFHIKDVFGDAETTADSMWIIALGRQGLFGFIGFVGMLAGAPLAAIRGAAQRRSTGRRSESAVKVAVLIIVMVFAMDCIFNAMLNPIIVMAAGALVTNRMPAPVRRRRRRLKPVGPVDETKADEASGGLGPGFGTIK
ncbi:MAG: hypothetical protein AAGI53_00165 [Planctomycetota bacterium]